MNNINLHVLFIGADESEPRWKLLQHLPYIISDLKEVHSFDLGLQALARGDFDVCLLDGRVAGNRGLELLAQSVSLDCRTPIIFLAEPDDETCVKALHQGAADCLICGQIDSQLLERSIRYVLERQRANSLAQANALFAEADRRKGEFITELAHDLRNPLVALTAAVELVLLEDAESVDHERACGILDRQVRHLAQLVEDLLAKVHQEHPDVT